MRVCARVCVCVEEEQEGRVRKPPHSVYFQSCGRMRRSDKYVYVWDGKAGRENFVKQLLEFSVNWAELCPVI